MPAAQAQGLSGERKTAKPRSFVLAGRGSDDRSGVLKVKDFRQGILLQGIRSRPGS
jgi:hypothetical protein